jgi:hypothetical protein
MSVRERQPDLRHDGTAVRTPPGFYRSALGRADGLTASCRSVLLALSTSATAAGVVLRDRGPSISTIALRAGVSRPTAYRALAAAEAAGWLVRHSQRGRRHTNGYELVIPCASQQGVAYLARLARLAVVVDDEAKRSHDETQVEPPPTEEARTPNPRPAREPSTEAVQGALEALTAPLPHRDRLACRNSRAVQQEVARALAAGWTARALRAAALEQPAAAGMPWQPAASAPGLMRHRLRRAQSQPPPQQRPSAAHVEPAPERPTTSPAVEAAVLAWLALPTADRERLGDYVAQAIASPFLAARWQPTATTVPTWAAAAVAAAMTEHGGATAPSQASGTVRGATTTGAAA